LDFEKEANCFSTQDIIMKRSRPTRPFGGRSELSNRLAEINRAFAQLTNEGKLSSSSFESISFATINKLI